MIEESQFFLDEICQYLADNSSRFIYGDGDTNLKAGELIPGVDGVFADAAPSPQPDLDVAIEYHSIDFTAVNRETDTAHSDLRAIYNLFHQAHHYQTSNFYVHFSHALSQPISQGKDSEGRKLFQLGVLYIVHSLIS